MGDQLKDQFLFYNREQIIIRKQYIERISDIKFSKSNVRTYFSIYYCLNGKYWVKYNDNAVCLNRGDMIIADYDTDIHLSHGSSDEAEMYILDFLSEGVTDFGFSCTKLSELFNSVVLKNFSDNALAIKKDWVYHDENGDIRKLLDRTFNEYKFREFGYLTAMKLNLQSVILILFREFAKTQKNIGYSYYIQYVIDYIKTNYNKQVSLTEISEQFGYSVSYVSNRFKSEVGLSFVKYLQMYRIYQAVAMLRQTDYSVATVSESVGFYNLKYFEEKFKEIVGVTPLKYRKNSAKINPVYKGK